MRILIVDDHQIFRDGLKSCLVESKADYHVVGEADNGRDGIESATSLKPDLVIMDIAMPKLNGVDAARQILQTPHALRPKLLVLSSYADPEFVTEVLRVGASGYLLKSAAFEELISAIQTVEQGKIYLSPEIAGVVVDLHVREESSDNKSGGVFAALTAREREVIQLFAEGNDAKGIAAKLELSPKTVHAMRNKVMAKLDLHSVAELTKYAIRVGLTSLEA